MLNDSTLANTKITLVDCWDFEPVQDAHSVGNPRAANYDTSRIVRHDYAHPAYAALAAESQTLWQGSWGENNRFTYQGFLKMGEGSSMRAQMQPSQSINQVKHSYASSLKISGGDSKVVQILDSPAQIYSRLGFPERSEHKAPITDEAIALRGYINNNGGWADSAASMAWLRQQVLNRNRIIKVVGEVDSLIESTEGTHRTVHGVKLRGGQEIRADLTVVAAGAQTSKLVGMEGLCNAYSEVVAYIKLTDEECAEMQRRDMPVLVNVDLGVFALGPDHEGQFKVARCGRGGYEEMQQLAGGHIGARKPIVEVAKPSGYEFGWCSEETDVNEESLDPNHTASLADYRSFLGQIFNNPDHAGADTLAKISLRPFKKIRTCWYNDTKSNDFIIDYHPTCSSLFIATGGSDHAFKFLPTIGKRILAIMLPDSETGRSANQSFSAELRKLWKIPSDVLVC
jgi:sarcosine oxidase/L-pipecolate oxidase